MIGHSVLGSVAQRIRGVSDEISHGVGDSRGQIALWTSVETDGYFSNLTVK
jgi:hypothetical protein